MVLFKISGSSENIYTGYIITLPWIVNVFPEFVAPYVKSKQFSPDKKLCTRFEVVFSKRNF